MKYASLGLILSAFLLAGCGSSGSSGGGGGCCTVPGINVVVVSPIGVGTIDDNQGQALDITVQVNGDSSKAGVTWTVSPAVKGGPTGTLSGQQPLSVTFTPPDGITASTQVTVTATSVTDPTRSVAIPVIVYPALVQVTTSANLTTAYVNVGYTCIQQPITGQTGVLQIPCQVTVAGGLGPYNWSLGNSLLPPGLQLAPGIDQFSTQIVGTPTASGIYMFNLTATDATGNASTFSLTVNVAPSQLKVATPTLLEPIPGVPYTPVQLQASGGTPPYTWTVAGGSLPTDPATGKPVMTLSPSGVISGTPPPTGYIAGTFAVQVVDSQTPVPAQAVFPTPAPSSPSIINLSRGDEDHPCQSANTSIQANIPYAFVFAGFDTNGPVTFSGSFTADGSGNLTGVEDIIRSGNAQPALPLMAGSSITFNDSNTGCLTLATSSGTSVFRVAPTGVAADGFTEGRIIEFDDADGTGTRGSGSFVAQDSTAFATPPAGPFAFRFSGWASGVNHFAMAGTATVGDGSLTAVSGDVNTGGLFTGPLGGGGGTIGDPDTTGRGTLTLNVGSASYDLIYYIVDANHVLFNSSQPLSVSHPLITGEAASSVGPFSSATLSDSHIYRFGGTVPGAPDVGVGVLHFDGAGGLSGTAYERSGGTSSATTVSALYTVDPTSGRFTLSGTGISLVGYAVPSASGVTGYMIGMGASAASGTMEFQTNTYPPGYQFGPIGGHYGLGTEEMLDAQTMVTVGVEDPGPSGGLSVSSTSSHLYSNSLAGLVPFQEIDMFKYTWSADGSGSYGGNTFMVTNQSKFFYIDTSPLNAHPAVMVGQKRSN